MTLLFQYSRSLFRAYYEKLIAVFNYCIRSGIFVPQLLKVTEVKLDFKKCHTTSKTDSRQLSTLSNFSTIFEKLTNLQLNNYMKTKFQFSKKRRHSACIT